MKLIYLIILIINLIRLLIINFFQQPSTVFAYTPPPPPALPSSQIIFEDDFSQGLEKWELVSGFWGDWSITTNSKLEAFLSEQFQQTELVIKDQYWQDQWQNIVLEFEYQALTNADLNWGWAYRDPSNWTQMHLYGERIYYTNLQDNKAVYRAMMIYQFPRVESHRVIISINQKEINTWVDEKLVMGFTDHYEPLAFGKPFLRVTTGFDYPTQVRFDNFRVYLIDHLSDNEDEIDETELFFPLTEFKQYQEPWKSQEYNHALSWSGWGDWQANHPTQPPQQVTINHWGCALTSLAMVMRYHHLNQLPCGTELDPASLNNWLSRQADGYVGEGALNWLAGTRLSHQISQQYSTADNRLPSLEYSRHYLNLNSSLINILENQRPAILQIPGHFLVANGYVLTEDNTEDYFISDPAYDYQYLSMHDKPLASIVDLQPSNTDLSYIMAVYQPDLSVTFLDELDNPIANTTLSQDSLENPIYQDDECFLYLGDPSDPYPCLSHHSSPIMQLLAKPSSGNYQLQISGGGSEINHLKLYLYDQQAEVKIIDWYFLGIDEGDSKTLQFTFDKDNLSNSKIVNNQPQSNYENFFIALNRLIIQEDFSFALKYQLAEISTWAFENKDDLQALSRYQQLVLRLFYWYQDQLPANLFSFLAQS